MTDIKTKYLAVGKRKTAVAKVILTKGTGKWLINKRDFSDYFYGSTTEIEYLKKPFILCNLSDLFDLEIYVAGGGLSAQISAIKLGVAKSLCLFNTLLRPILTKNFLLTRDSRIKERRKYGLKKARKASQYSKR
jgi:small subunit ribosomal protein S9